MINIIAFMDSLKISRKEIIPSDHRAVMRWISQYLHGVCVCLVALDRGLTNRHNDLNFAINVK